MTQVLYTPRKFSQESLAIIAQADAICADYADQGYDLTLRQLYYQFVARGIIPNRQTEYKRLGSIINDARLAGLLSWDYIVDRTRNLSDLAHWTSPAEIVEAVARQYRIAKWDRQPTRVEVWIEKEALAGVVERICQQLDVPFFACRGYVSQSEQWRAAQRFGAAIEGGQRVVVLHLGDHDPSGIDMTRDNRERLWHFLTQDFLNAHGDEFDGESVAVSQIKMAMAEHCGAYADGGLAEAFTVERIALNMDQVEQYDPPPNPAKLTDSRVAGYLDTHGTESWELDALPPDVLAALIRDAVLDLRDDDLWDEDAGQEATQREQLQAVSDRWGDVVELVS